MIVPYRAVPSVRFGRMYATAPSGSKLSKSAGLVLFGQTHCEIDMVGAHVGIFIGLVSKHLYGGHAPPHPFVNVQGARRFLEDLLQGTPLAVSWPTYQKHLWPIALNSPDCVGHILRIVMRANVVVPEELRTALQLLSELKSRLAVSPDVTQPPSHHPRLAPHNAFYYIMEGYEAKFMLAFIRELVRNEFPKSVVFRCDGIYLMPPCSPALASHCADVAADCVGIPGLQVKYSCLRAERAAVLAQLYAQVAQGDNNAPPPFFTKLCQREWWENLHLPRPKENAGPAEQRKRAHEPVAAHADDPRTLFRFMKRRRLVPVSSSP